MKKLLVLPLAFGFLLIACEKEKTPAAPCNVKPNPHLSSREAAKFKFLVYTDPVTLEPSCPPPNVDCLWVKKNSATSFDAIDLAISNGPQAVTDFFTSDAWQEPLPDLIDFPSVLEGLKNASYTMVRRTNSNGEIFYIVVNYAAGQNYQPSDVVCGFMLPVE